MHDSQAKFQQLLRELFQFDSADLDFGVYRIMNHKRDVIERFIAVELPQAIAAELDHGALAEQTQLQHELAEATRQIRETLGDAALDADGNLSAPYHAIPLGKKYLELRASAAGARSHDAQEAAVYNHLYTFISRYYQEGDFISKRRYSKHARYAIPYNGEEVTLYWANHDQYYVKSGEYFTDYSYKAPNGATVHFKLQAADVEQNNVKGDRRFFLPHAEATEWDARAGVLVIPCVYRPLTQQEATRYGKSNQQEAITAQAVAAIPARLGNDARALAALTAERRTDAKGNPITYLEHHLRQYTRRNTSDFFIHKDLAGFLRRELDFYLKNEVLNLEEVEAAGEELAAGWFQLLRLIKRVGGRIIDFLAQIEAFQKMLWEKRKFVTEAFYCVRVGVIAQEFYPEIAANAAQWQAWQTLFALDDPQTPAQRTQLLKTHPSLVLDTRCFAPEFVDRLSAAFDNLDGWTDGLLVHSENWQALNLLGERYRERVQCIHIDPPYNTQSSGFLYKNSYQHSSWLSMMHDRIEASIGILEESGLWACHIDEYEIEKLQMLLDGLSLFDGGTLIWDKGMPNTGANGLATQHEYVLFRAQMATPKIRVQKKNITAINTKIQELVVAQGGPTKEAIAEYRKWLRSQRQLSKAERTYDQFDETGNAFRSDNMSATDKRTDPKFHVPLKHPITGQNCPVPEYGWRYTPDSMAKLLQSSTILFGDDHTSMPRKKTYLESTHDSQMPSMYKSGSRGKSDLDEYMLEFPFAHSVEFYTYLIDSLTRVRSIALDFFAGSGTTGHAVINLNREDGGRRKFILVEMGNYFDTVLLPRILKVTYTPEWKEGKPKRLPTAEEVERSPRLIKVLRLESYEDALNNIDFDDAAGQPALRFDDYLLQYMLRWETRHSETLLNVEKLDRPFAYTLHLHRDGETRTQPVDLPETFNYLLGLAVRTRQVLFDNVHSGRDARVPGNTGVSPALGNPGVRYLVYRGVLRDGRTVAVLWRDTAGWTEADYTRDRDFVAAQKLAEDVDDLFVNGDSFIPGAQALEGVFKARMFAEV